MIQDSSNKFMQSLCDDDLLYHFTEKDILLDAILPDKTIKLSNLSGSGDPLEFMPINLIGSSWGKSVQKTLERVIEIDAELNSIIKKRFKFISFCTDDQTIEIVPFNKGVCHSRMWVQYGERHSGACLVFSKKMLIDSISKFLDTKYSNGEFIFHHGLINYDNSLEFLDGARIVQGSDAIKNNFIKNYLKTYSKEHLFTKLEDYKDEAEYRIAIYQKEFNASEDLYLPMEDSLTEIIYGQNFDDTDQKRVEEYSETLGFDSHLIDWENGKPKVWQIQL